MTDQLVRVPGWEKRLAEVIARHEDWPFAWGRADCATVAAECVEAITGRDLLAEFRGRYHSRLSCYARLKARGFRRVRDAARATLAAHGCPVIDPRAARVGDVGVTGTDTLCVRAPAGFIARLESGRFVVVPCEIAFKIG